MMARFGRTKPAIEPMETPDMIIGSIMDEIPWSI
jgi:hypothetical protein